jgi:hypothetical protein
MNKAPFNFNKWNTIIGWFTFVIALITYTLTVEPTMSFGTVENIATAAKLQVNANDWCLLPCLLQITNILH